METTLLVAGVTEVLMIPDGIFLNILFMFPEQDVMQIGNLPYVMNDVMHREPLFAECCQYC